MSILSDINNDLDSMKSDLTKKKIINQYKHKSIKPQKKEKLNDYDDDEEDEKSTITDVRLNKNGSLCAVRKYDEEKKIKTKNKKLQVEFENYNKTNKLLSEKIENL